MSDELTKAIDAYRIARKNSKRLFGDYKRLRDATNAALEAAQKARESLHDAERDIWRLVDPEPLSCDEIWLR